jgi:hypothetical protein
VTIAVLAGVLCVGAIVAYCMLRSRRLAYEEWGARKHMAGKLTHPAGMGGGAVMANGQAIALDDIAVLE